MRKNILITTMLVLALMPMVLAATTLNVPVTGTNYTSITFNCTTALDKALNVSIFYNASGGATGTSLGSIANTSADQTEFTSSAISIEALTDGTTYNMTCYADNATDQEYSAGVASVGIDNTNPTCSVTRLRAKPAYKDLQEVVWATTDATSGLTSTAVTIDRPESGADMTYTDASRTLQLTSQDTKYVGDWTATVVATDTAGNSNTCSVTWKTYLPDGEISEGGTTSSNVNTKGIIIFLVIAIGAYLLLKK